MGPWWQARPEDTELFGSGFGKVLIVGQFAHPNPGIGASG